MGALAKDGIEKRGFQQERQKGKAVGRGRAVTLSEEGAQ